MKLSVVLLTGEKIQFNVNKDSCVIGRSLQCDVVIPHESMSRKHCLLEIKSGDIYITDLGSSNGVSIEGQKIPPNTPVPYQSYFSLSFGAAQSVSVTLEDTTPDAREVQESNAPGLPKTQSPTKGRTKPAISLPPKKQAKSGQTKSLVIILIGLIIVAAIYVYFVQEPDQLQPTPAQLYE